MNCRTERQTKSSARVPESVCVRVGTHQTQGTKTKRSSKDPHDGRQGSADQGHYQSQLTLDQPLPRPSLLAGMQMLEKGLVTFRASTGLISRAATQTSHSHALKSKEKDMTGFSPPNRVTQGTPRQGATRRLHTMPCRAIPA